MTLGESIPAYTGPAEWNFLGHRFAHVVEGVILRLLLWGIGSVVYLVAGGRKRAAAVGKEYRGHAPCQQRLIGRTPCVS